MNYFPVKILILLMPMVLHAKPHDIWNSFIDEKSELIGFKDSKGFVKIKPKFMGYTTAKKFEYIIAVMEKLEDDYKTYYLTKSGKAIGFDSLYIFDNSPDCESEGYIRFKDKESDKVGLFNHEGNVVIPAVYNGLSKVQNGLIWALKGAQKKYFNGHKESGCNHYTWEGGQELLLSTNHEILVQNFNNKGYLDFYSSKVDMKATTDSTRRYFKGTNGKFYSFINMEKHFDQWIQMFVKKITLNKINAISDDSITYWKEPKGWVTKSKTAFFKSNFSMIEQRLNKIRSSKSNHFITVNGLNPFMFNGPNYSKYFNNCGESKMGQYPVLDLIINESDSTQDIFEFLKTDDGYRLISVSIRSGKLQ